MSLIIIGSAIIEPAFASYRGVGQGAQRAFHLGQVRAGDDGRWLVVDAHLEPRGAPSIAKLLQRRRRRSNGLIPETNCISGLNPVELQNITSRRIARCAAFSAPKRRR